MTLGPWLFKLEAIQRSGALNLRGREEDYIASVIGGDTRSIPYLILLPTSPCSVNGTMMTGTGMRHRAVHPARSKTNSLWPRSLAFNDIQSTEMTVSFIGDLGRATHSLLSDWTGVSQTAGRCTWRRLFCSASTGRTSTTMRAGDSFIELGLSYNF